MEYKNTLNLPKTDFPMKADLSRREPETINKWRELDIYGTLRKDRQGKKKYTLHDGPPYANGDIHIGHALNKTLKDIVVKHRTMCGLDCAYVPGWDCHGLPVEHQLFKELKINKYQINQVDFRLKAHDYAMSYVFTQKEQFKRLGVFADWDNPYLTLLPEYEEAIVRSFADLTKKGYIYRGLKPVNWCSVCETALAEAEVEYEDHASPSVFVKFELENPQDKIGKSIIQGKKIFAVVWTTTPWTLIANVAIAVHPDFNYSLVSVKDEIWIIQEELADALMERFGVKEYSMAGNIIGKELEGARYIDIFKPPRRNDLKVVLANYVSKEDGSGCVHTAPGHGQEDYSTGQRYGLETLMPVDGKGCFCQDIAGEFKGQHVFDANKNIIQRLKEQGDLLYAGQINHSYPHCWRCKTPIIFRATSQWFMDIDKAGLRDKLQNSVENDITWVPSSGKERIAAMISLRPDWCLSRQRYWGVPIPALYCKKCGEEKLYVPVIEKFADIVAKEGSDSWFKRDVSQIIPDGFICPDCKGSDFEKACDILDVWFDSGVSHQAVLKKRPELSCPADLYLEGSDQHRGWFQASLISSMAIDGKPPFKAVLTHGFVVDGEGRKMSKSMGNVISPANIIKDSGADILRLWVASSDYNEDIRISPEILTRLSEAYRKVRNTVRFILSNLYDFKPDTDRVSVDSLREIDKWILARSARMFDNVFKAYMDFEFYKAYKGIYDFCNEDLSMAYLDMAKGRLYTCAAASLDRRSAQTVMHEVLNVLVRVMAPILAFTAEEIWQYMPKSAEDKAVSSVHFLTLRPQGLLEAAPARDALEKLAPIIGFIGDIAKALESKRGAGIIGSSFDAEIIILTNDEKRYTYLESLKSGLPEIFKVSQVGIEKSSDLSGGVKNDKYPDISVIVKKAGGVKCVRCWNYSSYIGSSKMHPELCDRCLEAIAEENTK